MLSSGGIQTAEATVAVDMAEAGTAAEALKAGQDLDDDASAKSGAEDTEEGGHSTGETSKRGGLSNRRMEKSRDDDGCRLSAGGTHRALDRALA